MESKICQECNERPVPEWRKIYCDGCAEIKNQAFESGKAKPMQIGAKTELITSGTETRTVSPKPANGNTAMYVSYAKDIFIAIITSEKYNRDKTDKEEMEIAIALVKQAKTAFE